MEFLYRPLEPHLVFKWHFHQLGKAAEVFGPVLKSRKVMLQMRKFGELGEINRDLCDVHAADSTAINEVFRALVQTRESLRLAQLIQSAAWTDAALMLIDLELPMWQVRRLTYDNGEWYCALSRERELPDWLDQSIETRHPDLALAILSAFVDARRVSVRENRTSVPDVRGTTQGLYETLPTDNYA